MLIESGQESTLMQLGMNMKKLCIFSKCYSCLICQNQDKILALIMKLYASKDTRLPCDPQFGNKEDLLRKWACDSDSRKFLYEDFCCSEQSDVINLKHKFDDYSDFKAKRDNWG